MQPDNEIADEVAINGFAVVREIVKEREISKLISVVEALRQRGNDTNAAGVRHLLKRSAIVRQLANSKAILDLAAKIVGPDAKPVKAILFDKTPDANWYVTWHQDLTIAVKERIDMNGFGPWSIKDGIQHVQPPREVLQNIVSLRIHLDDCPTENGAIKFIAGSHNVGVLDANEIAHWRDSKTHVCCSAARGDVILMRPLVLHSSSQSTKADHRRVLHIEFVGTDLPGGLNWAESSGLDTVELVIGIEEEFGIDIPNEVAETLTTVGITYQFLRTRLDKSESEECLSQKIFYKLRKALVNNFQINRQAIAPDTKVTDLLTQQELEEGWPYLQVFIDLRIPHFKTPDFIFLFKTPGRTLTMREIVFAMMGLNRDKLDFSKSSEAEVWNRLVDVIVSQLNVNVNEVTYDTSFTKDLGAC